MFDGEGVFPDDFRALVFDTYDFSIAVELVKLDILPRPRGAPLVMTIQVLVALSWQEGSKEGSWFVSHDNELE